MSLFMKRVPFARVTSSYLYSGLNISRPFHRGMVLQNETKLPEPLPTDPENTLGRLKASGKIEPELLETIDNLKFRALTKVQDKSIVPAIDAEKGIVVRAKTGTGKTLSYLIPIFNQLFPSRSHSLKNKHRVFHLIIVPTRDLAVQIEREIDLFRKGHPELKTAFSSRVDVLTGGKRSHLVSLFSPSIVIATPGRLISTLKDKKLGGRFRSLKSVVLDEADRLLDSGFKNDIEEVVRLLREKNISNQNGKPETFKFLLYSATVDGNVSEFAKTEIGENFTYIDCVEHEDTEAHENINQVLVKTKTYSESIHGTMSHAIKNLPDDLFKALLFLPTIKQVDWVFDTLRDSVPRHLGRKIFRVHGQMTQSARDRALLNFRRSKGGILICTDVAARGLDFPDISTVLQTSASSEIASYIHKIGRTGRAGRSGDALLFASNLEAPYVTKLEKEKQIVFNEKKDYDTYEEDKELINYRTEEGFNEALESLLLYYNQVANTYNFDSNAAMKDVLGFYQTVTGLDERMEVEYRILKVLNIPRRIADSIFVLPDGYNSTKDNRTRNNSKSKFNTFDRRSNQRDSYKRDNGRDSYKRDNRDSYRKDNRDSYQRDNRDSYQRDSRDSYKRDNRESYRSSDRGSRDFQKKSDRGSRGGSYGNFKGPRDYEQRKSYDGSREKRSGNSRGYRESKNFGDSSD